VGQSLWYDNIERGMIKDGALAQLIKQDCVVGVTSNPSIFQKAISTSRAYDAQLRELLTQRSDMPPKELYEALAITDIQAAADLLQPIYEQTRGRDGYVSLEVSPTLADATGGTIAEARRLFAAVNRPNLMIKIPATPAGLPAITEVLAAGINVNVTLIFSHQNYTEVAEAYLAGLEKLSVTGRDLSRVASVASLFVSRFDTLLDRLLAEHGHPEAKALQGRLAIANAKLVYKSFKETFGHPRFLKLVTKGARVQRPLWASTSAKNPAYRDVMYAEALIGPNTVNTAPPVTIKALKAHGQIQATLADELAEAEVLLARLASFGISYDQVTCQLQREGLASFAQAFDRLLQGLEEKRRTIIAGQNTPLAV
jgi:transaldolase